jgi:hypothetical protein
MNPPLLGRLRAAAPAGLAALLGLTLFLFGYQFQQDPGSFNSDDLYPAAVCDDVLVGRELPGWHMPAAPYPFPDVLLLLPCRAAFGNIAAAFAAYAALFYALLLAAVAWVLRRAGLGWRPAFLAAGTGVLFLLATHLRPGYLGRALLLYHAGNHMGALLVGLLLTGLVLRGVQQGYGWWSPLVILAAGSLGGFSDKLLVVQFIAPLAAAVGMLTLCRLVRFRRAAQTVLLLGLAVAGALWMKDGFTRLGFVLLAAENEFILFAPFDPGQFAATVWSCLSAQPITAALAVFHLVAAALLLLAWLPRRLRIADCGLRNEGNPQSPDRTAVLFVGLTLLAAPVCNLGALVCTGMTCNPAIDRYLHACFALPYLCVAVWPALAPGRAARLGGALVQGGVAAFALYLAAGRLPAVRWENCGRRYPEIARALDDMVRKHGGPLRGFAEFWSSRSLCYLTQEHVEVRPACDTGQPWPHASNLSGYLSADRHDTATPDYHFVLFSVEEGKRVPSPRAVRREYGEPAEKKTVGSYEIWRYETLQSRHLELFLRSQLAVRLRHEWTPVVPDQPRALRKSKWNLTPWTKSGNVFLRHHEPLEVRFARPVTGRLVDVSAHFPDRFRLDFYLDDRYVASANVPAVWWAGAVYDRPGSHGLGLERPGLQCRLVPLPAACAEQPWNRVRVVPTCWHEPSVVGHFLVYANELPYRVTPASLPGTRRHEGEWLDGDDRPGVRDAADPSASGGAVRRLDAGDEASQGSGPHNLLPGRYRIDFALAVDDNTTPDAVADVEVYAEGMCWPLRSRQLDGTDFPAPRTHAVFSLTLETEEELEMVEYRLRSTGRTGVSLDYIDVTRLPDEAAR